nr:MAG TPA: hypothetical protein [Bacteriophage sp.]
MKLPRSIYKVGQEKILKLYGKIKIQVLRKHFKILPIG